MQQNTKQTKNLETTAIDQIANFIGIVAAVSAVIYVFKSIAQKTDTNIISNDARRVLENQDEARKLRKAIDTYHVTGDWKQTNINEIL